MTRTTKVHDTEPSPPTPHTRGASHSIDFTSVNWFGHRFTFRTGQQAKAVELLWREWERGEFTVGQQTIGEHVGTSSENFQLIHLFRTNARGAGRPMHPAWGVMITRVNLGVYRLSRPALAGEGTRS